MIDVMMRFSSFMIGLFAVLVLGCNSHKQMLERGDYYGAVMKSVDKLRSNGNNKKAKQTLREAYPLAVDEQLKVVKKVHQTNDEFRKTKSLSAYESINRLYEEVQKSPAAKRLLPKAKGYFKEIGNLKPLAAEEQYAAGMLALKFNTRDHAKEAYRFFEAANGYVYNYKSAQKKMEESLYLATLHVVVDKIPVPSRTYNLSAEFFYDQVNDVLNKIEREEFVKFYTNDEARRMRDFKPDQVIRMNFDDFLVGNTHTKERLEKIEKDSVVVGKVKNSDGSSSDVYGTVKANFTTSKIQVISNGVLRLVVQDTNRRTPVLNENLGGEFVWFHEWANYKGDERALTKKQIQLSNKRPVLPPPPQQLFVEFTKPIYRQLSNVLRSYYRDI